MRKFRSGLITATAAIVISCGLAASPALAGYVVILEQQGSNVVATGTGGLDLTGLHFFGNIDVVSGMNPSVGVIITGPASLVPTDLYAAPVGVTNPFGSGSGLHASSGSGDLVGVSNGLFIVPQSYVSGTVLSDTSTYDNATFSSLGLTPGSYKWMWGAGANQKFTLQVGAAALPDPPIGLRAFALVLLLLFGAKLQELGRSRRAPLP